MGYANEICMTGDANPKQFKSVSQLRFTFKSELQFEFIMIRFFQWSTIWQPEQLNQEYDEKLWLTIQAPLDVC
jgi:hypothetical protein